MSFFNRKPPEPPQPPPPPPDPQEVRLETVRAALARYEHPLFVFDPYPEADEIHVAIRYRFDEPQLHTYVMKLKGREIEHSQFAWTFQKQLYDSIYDFVIEMFSNNPQRQN
jgi:hypothetical protein